MSAKILGHPDNCICEDCTKPYHRQAESSFAAPTGLSGVEMIAAERQRQISKEKWTAAHDDAHDCGEMGQAAGCYIAQARGRRWLPPEKYRNDDAPEDWPWDEKWWKPRSPIRDLVRAGALIAAEIDRLQRIEAKAR